MDFEQFAAQLIIKRRLDLFGGTFFLSPVPDGTFRYCWSPTESEFVIFAPLDRQHLWLRGIGKAIQQIYERFLEGRTHDCPPCI